MKMNLKKTKMVSTSNKERTMITIEIGEVNLEQLR